MLFNLFKKLVYGKSENEYTDVLDTFSNNEIISKYQNFSEHVKNSYLTQKNDWALSERIAQKLETDGTNTTNYIETSF